MLLSKRRLQWTAIGLLIVCALLMLRPARTWIEQVWIARALSPQLTIGELIVHSKKSIVEVRDLKWQGSGLDFVSKTGGGASGYIGVGKTDGGASGHFGINARRCWLAVDRNSLASGKLRVPKIVFQNADLYLAGDLPHADDRLADWRQHLAIQLVDFHWESLQRQFKSLPAAEKLRSSWRESIDDWGKRSRQILVEATRLEHQVEAMDNPLRFEESINAKLAQFQQLADEQRSLVSHLEQLEGSLVTESERLNQLHQQDLLSFAGLSSEAKLKHAIDTNHADFEQEMAVVIGEAVWNRLAPFGEIVDKFSHAAASIQTADYDVTVRSLEFGSEQLRRSEIKATGDFQAGLVKSHYQTRGTWRIAQQTPAETFREFNFLTVFHGNTIHSDVIQGDSNQIDVSSQYDSRQSAGTHLQIVMVDRPQRGANPSSSSPPPAGTAEQTRSTESKLISDAGRLTGSLIVAPSTLKMLPWKLPPVVVECLGAEASGALRFELCGDWDHPQLTLISAAPAWLRQAVERLASQQAQVAIAKSKLQLETEFSMQLVQLRRLVDVAVREAKQSAKADERKLLVSQARLHEQLDMASGAAFASRPGEVNR